MAYSYLRGSQGAGPPSGTFLPLVAGDVASILPSKFSAGGRLTLTSGTPVLVNSSVAGATTVFYTPYQSQLVPLYDGTNMIMTDVGGELSQTTTDATKSPAAVAASSNYDIFVWNDSGTFRATRGPAWTNNTTRNLALSPTKGVWLNGANITNGPAVQRGTYVGTIASNASSTIDFIFGGSASGGIAGSFNVWNYYNRVNIGTFVFDTGAPYTYTSNTTRQARASAGNQISFLVGMSEDSYTAWIQSFVTTVAVAGAGPVVGMGINSTTVFLAADLVRAPSANAFTSSGKAYWTSQATLGMNTLARIEQGDNSNANSMAVFGGDQINLVFPM